LVQNGEEITVSAVHAGLECGTFKKLKPDLDMVSIGPDLTD
jgi:dipeptidase D